MSPIPDISPDHALLAIAWNAGRGGCEHSTSGLGSCWRYGRKLVAEFGADTACSACIAAAALGLLAEVER